jgi:hypothetical protein
MGCSIFALDAPQSWIERTLNGSAAESRYFPAQ